MLYLSGYPRSMLVQLARLFHFVCASSTFRVFLGGRRRASLLHSDFYGSSDLPRAPAPCVTHGILDL